MPLLKPGDCLQVPPTRTPSSARAPARRRSHQPEPQARVTSSWLVGGRGRADSYGDPAGVAIAGRYPTGRGQIHGTVVSYSSGPSWSCSNTYSRHRADRPGQGRGSGSPGGGSGDSAPACARIGATPSRANAPAPHDP